ncbi:unnamed protein product [Owenia fusiformis]|uniref:Uncharacterized protein n=1 Tax=Owenia fusiformis TaxID=6347 RepID=A0A8J1XFB2_OWEFU|nr:unnamed protein product [Owenia fusiformis]
MKMTSDRSYKQSVPFELQFYSEYNTTDMTQYSSTECPSIGDEPPGTGGRHIAVTILITIPMVFIIVAGTLGNGLVILSVFKFERLRSMANRFIVSLAFADLLVSATVTPFSAIKDITGQWYMGAVMCDIIQANDILFSTASILHLCCISIDRYMAIMYPYQYVSSMTKHRVIIMIVLAWLLSALLAFVPIHTQLYTDDCTRERRLNGNYTAKTCDLIVNTPYAVISSSVSFWIPATIMVFTYIRIFREARVQEKRIHTMAMNARNSVDNPSSTSSSFGEPHRNGINNNKVAVSHTNGNDPSSPQRLAINAIARDTKQERKRLKREHKAAKTLGMIMGGFILCWLPFFSWYLITQGFCQGFNTECNIPNEVISLFFWIGYFNSMINPVIYAYFNRDFRTAFRKILHFDQWPCAQSGATDVGSFYETTNGAPLANQTLLNVNVRKSVSVSS